MPQVTDKGQIEQRLKQVIAQFDEAGRNHYMLRNFDDYLFHRRHLDRLLYMLELLLPYCGADKRIADLGSNIVFPYLVKLCSDAEACDGVAKTLERSEYFVFREDGSTVVRPLEYPFTNMASEPGGIAVPLIHCDLSRNPLPYRNASLDVVTCFETLEHLHSDPMNLMAEVNRTLKPDGIFMLTTPNANSISNLKRSIRHESPNFYPPFIRNMDFIEHVKEYSVKEIRLLFQSAGFEIERLETFDHVRSDEFNHYEAYQIDYADADEAELSRLRERDAELEKAVVKLLERDEGASLYRGDYVLVFARKVSEVNNRYCFPVYEKFEL
ncbi:methyltransferase domain-containing protein [Cohnella zeiphila]|uniref:Methyltransferase domain-containing protein n=1 Tax=Cohnella zeiphila TaxID=2761120 RepID=A0A7X0VU36_9BACL|nr:methyltransferase domain-containing protein [Cohnella zeiphila]MBB6729970.1 methyltransferase domain-containing protein [Cohnella zeiphila]